MENKGLGQTRMGIYGEGSQRTVPLEMEKKAYMARKYQIAFALGPMGHVTTVTLQGHGLSASAGLCSPGHVTDGL
jgi:hypothetical protein